VAILATISLRMLEESTVFRSFRYKCWHRL